MSLIVQKFGGSSVSDAEGIKRVAQRVVEEATPDVMFTNPQHERTQAFLHAVLGSSDGQIGTH